MRDPKLSPGATNPADVTLRQDGAEVQDVYVGPGSGTDVGLTRQRFDKVAAVEAGGSQDLTGTATGTLTTSGSVLGQAGRQGTATGTLTTSGVALGQEGSQGTASGTLVTSGAVVGQLGYSGTATGTLTTSGTALGQEGSQGTATGSITLTGVVTGGKFQTGGQPASGGNGHPFYLLPPQLSAIHLSGTAHGVIQMYGTAAGIGRDLTPVRRRAERELVLTGAI